MYADTVTDSIRMALDETGRRRALQTSYNEAHGITPASIVKQIDEVLSSVYAGDYLQVPMAREGPGEFRTQAELDAGVTALAAQMRAAAENLDFERAASLRDRIRTLKSRELGLAAGRAAR